MVQVIEEVNPFTFCNKEKECGHQCKGVAGESECLPCLNLNCIQEAIEASRSVDEIESENDDNFLKSFFEQEQRKRNDSTRTIYMKEGG